MATRSRRRITTTMSHTSAATEAYQMSGFGRSVMLELQNSNPHDGSSWPFVDVYQIAVGRSSSSHAHAGDLYG